MLLSLWERERQTVLFVTHDLSEALTLSDRIILMSARPGPGEGRLQVDFPRPRDAVKLRETPAVCRRCSPQVWHSLGEEFAKGRSVMSGVDDAVRQIAIGLGALAIWNGAVTCTPTCRGWCPYILDPYFVSKPSEIFKQFLRMRCLVSPRGEWTLCTPGAFERCIGRSENNLWIATFFTLKNTLWGFSTGVSSGFVLGLLLGRSDRLSEIFYPYITAFNSIPRIALAPIIILSFGIGDASKIVTASLVVVFLVFFNTFEGARSSTATTSMPPACCAPAMAGDAHRIVPSTMAWLFASLPRLSSP